MPVSYVTCFKFFCEICNFAVYIQIRPISTKKLFADYFLLNHWTDLNESLTKSS